MSQTSFFFPFLFFFFTLHFFFEMLRAHPAAIKSTSFRLVKCFHAVACAEWRSHQIIRQYASPPSVTTPDFEGTSYHPSNGTLNSTPSSYHVPQLAADFDLAPPVDPYYATRFNDQSEKLLETSIDYDNDYFIPKVQKALFKEEPFEQVHWASPLGHTMTVEASKPLVDPTVAPLFPASTLEFNFACGGYAYHSSKNPPRQTLISSLPEALFSGTAAQLPLSLNNGSSTLIMKRYAEGETPINECPVEAFDKLEFGDMTSMACGEDSVVASTQLLGLADGVSGWSHHTGGHAALWSRLILHRTISHFVDNYNKQPTSEISIPPLSSQSMSGTLELQTQSSIDALKALDDAFVDTKAILTRQQETGSSTLILAALNVAESSLEVLNIGDSSIWVFRNGEVVFTVNHAVKSENCPRQLGTNSKDLPSNIVSPFSIPILPNDLILMCSDGVSDNLWINEITDILKEKYDEEAGTGSLQAAADAIVLQATDRSFDNFAVCPYQLNASPFSTGGGKTDDISVLLAKVSKV